jgi:N-acetylneuraminic acid mutarotase
LEGTGKVLITGEPARPLKSTILLDTLKPQDMTVARYRHAATLLLNGKVLITGGICRRNHIYNTAEIFDPVSNTFKSTVGAMESPRAYHTATLLPDGKVLIAGGYSQNQCGSNPIYAEIYDPATDSFTKTSNMNSDRSSHQATLLPDRTVLITGGYSCSLANLDTAEITILAK